VLDEATCHLHPAAEAEVEREFAATGRTVVIVAHRMSSAIRASRVALLDRGRLAVGSHADLVRSSRLYHELVGHWEAAG
jgi:ABC-type multidrug transport system fused ATPase/permease subunit